MTKTEVALELIGRPDGASMVELQQALIYEARDVYALIWRLKKKYDIFSVKDDWRGTIYMMSQPAQEPPPKAEEPPPKPTPQKFALYHYERVELGVPLEGDITQAVLKAAWRVKIKAVHPDTSQDGSTEAVDRVQQAYEKLQRIAV